MIKSKHLIALAMSAFIAMGNAFADEAPVYDVDNTDNYPPSFEQSDSGDTTPSPPVERERLVEGPRPANTMTLTPQQRLAQVEQQIKNLQTSSASSKIDALQADVRALRGELEEWSHQLEQLKSAQKAMYSDLENQLDQIVAKTNALQAQTTAKAARIHDLDEDNNDSVTTPRDTIPAGAPKLLSAHAQEGHGPLTVKKPAATTADADEQAQPNAEEEQQIYQTAYDLIKAKKYNEAITALQSMLKKYPRGQFAANAHYWLGELYGLLNKNAQSAAEFAIVVKNYPDSPKSSDAQLKLGLIYVGEFKWVDAKSAFKKVLDRAPGTASARLAMEQLKQIKKAGH